MHPAESTALALVRALRAEDESAAVDVVTAYMKTVPKQERPDAVWKVAGVLAAHFALILDKSKDAERIFTRQVLVRAGGATSDSPATGRGTHRLERQRPG